MGAKNRVIAGDYEGCGIIKNPHGSISVVLGIFNNFPLDKSTVTECQDVDSETGISATSAITRGAIGSFLLGPVGLLAAASAKKKGVHLVGVYFYDGQQSLIEIDEKLYKILVRAMF